jgi:Reverse transcriptase (RNA-dependent DNA polymerase)
MSEEILLLFQSCLTVGHHLLIWKDAIAVTIPKPNKSDYSAAKAYCPISLLKCFSKLLEKIVARCLTFDAGQHNLIPPTQFSRCQNTSINNAALMVVHDIQRAWQCGYIATVLTFDISGYFNNIHHSFLVQMLKARGFSSNLV